MGDDEPGAMGAAEHRRLGRPHIFAVNGDPDVLNLLRILFQREEYGVRHCQNKVLVLQESP